MSLSGRNPYIFAVEMMLIAIIDVHSAMNSSYWMTTLMAIYSIFFSWVFGTSLNLKNSEELDRFGCTAKWKSYEEDTE